MTEKEKILQGIRLKYEMTELDMVYCFRFMGHLKPYLTHIAKLSELNNLPRERYLRIMSCGLEIALAGFKLGIRDEEKK